MGFIQSYKLITKTLHYKLSPLYLLVYIVHRIHNTLIETLPIFVLKKSRIKQDLHFDNTTISPQSPLKSICLPFVITHVINFEKFVSSSF